MSMRTFIAIKVIPGPELLKACQGLKDSLSADKINWVPEENMHITLHFLGETSDIQLAEVKALMKSQLSGRAAFPVHIGGVSYFGRQPRPGALFFQIEHSEELLDTAGSLKAGLQELGFSKGGAYKPHLTIGRIKWLSNRELFHEKVQLSSFKKLQTVWVKEAVLFQSILTPEGPVYRPLAVFPLLG